MEMNPEKENTKELLLAEAKKSFYIRGYFNTSFKDICEPVGVSQGQITYHFKTKDSLVQNCYQDLYKAIEERIDQSGYHLEDELLRHFVRVRILYKALTYDENTTRFFLEIAELEGQIRYNRKFVSDQYHKIINQYKLPVSNSEFMLVHNSTSAARRTLFKDYFEKKAFGNLPFESIITFLEKQAALCLGLEEKTVNAKLLQSINIAADIDLGDIRFLI